MKLRVVGVCHTLLLGAVEMLNSWDPGRARRQGGGGGETMRAAVLYHLYRPTADRKCELLACFVALFLGPWVLLLP